jgi:selenobiotic family peptide radical SAM maturase
MEKNWNTELTQLRNTLQKVSNAATPQYPTTGKTTIINPSLELLVLPWKNLTSLLQNPKTEIIPEAGEELVVIFKQPDTGDVCYYPATGPNLLALKVFSEKLDRRRVAKEAQVDVGRVDAAIQEAREQGILLAPASSLQRPETHFPNTGLEGWEHHLQSNYFTLQWHVTQACDLHCKHCYDRSEISPLTLEQGITILDQFRDFVLKKNVKGQVTFTGGNPLLYKHFTELYKEAAKRNFNIAILGNPTTRDVVQSLQDIQPLSFYQVSLEGMEEQNDSIRGAGHFKRIMEFLRILDELNIYSMVMLTLTRENMGQVLELGEFLRGKVDLFTFNRLSQTGEGARLATAEKDAYEAFLKEYVKAVQSNPTMGLKDNLINIVKLEQGAQVFGGCTGFGCGAAFNFCSILPNGDMHACRKFQSPIGNVLQSSLLELYDSPIAEQYRMGPEECRGCKIRPVCGGCQAVIQSSGLDFRLNKDPYCFLEN